MVEDSSIGKGLPVVSGSGLSMGAVSARAKGISIEPAAQTADKEKKGEYIFNRFFFFFICKWD